MKKACEFLKDCDTFFVLTMNDAFPAGRPFGAVMEYENDLYISTGDMKDVYKQLKRHPQMQIVAIKSGTREWIRISGVAKECNDMRMKERMLKECPQLTRHFHEPDELHYIVFKIEVVGLNYY